MEEPDMKYPIFCKNGFTPAGFLNFRSFALNDKVLDDLIERDRGVINIITDLLFSCLRMVGFSSSHFRAERFIFFQNLANRSVVQV